MTHQPSPGPKPTKAVGRAAVLFVGVGYGLLEAVDLFTERFGLPDWTFTAVALLLVAGLPVVLATAWFSAVRASGTASGQSARSLPSHHALFTWRNAALGGVGVFALLGLAQSAVWITGGFGPSEAEWAATEGSRLMEAHAEAREMEAGFEVAIRVLGSGTTDSTALGQADQMAPMDTIVSEPMGAEVYRRPWGGTVDDRDAAWEPLGTTPLVLRVPRAWMQYRMEMPGYAPSWAAWAGTQAGPDPVPVLVEEADPTARMARVSERDRPLFITGLDHLPPPEDLPGFLIDRYEVTNSEYRTFLDAGGYTAEEYWTEDFVEGGVTVPFEAAMTRFVDTTGRPGPATWVAGDYPDGQDDYPVTGVSWFEAAAYARFVGKSLPTVWHWNRASTPERSDRVVPMANLSGGLGPMPVGASQSMSTYGVFDMAGNAREWVYNADPATGSRYLFGGGWGDPGGAGGTRSVGVALARPVRRDPGIRRGLRGVQRHVHV
jgi:formylglycine-generating enzyme required for sulfatase activity